MTLRTGCVYEIVESNDGPVGDDRFRRIDANDRDIFIDERQPPAQWHGRLRRPTAAFS